MTDETLSWLVVLPVALACGLIVATLFWFVASRLTRGTWRAHVCRFGSATVFLLVIASVSAPIHDASSRGVEFCIVCGERAYVARLLGLRFADVQEARLGSRTVWAMDAGRPEPAPSALSYAQVFADAIGPHDHRWRALPGGGAWYRYAVDARDRELTRTYVARLNAVSDDLRLEFVLAFDGALNSSHPAAALFSQDPESAEWRTSWRLSHPNWP